MCGTIMLSKDIPDLYAYEQFGHSEIKITKKYQPIRLEEKSKLENVIDDYFEARLRQES